MDYFLPTEYLSPSEFELFANQLVGILTGTEIHGFSEGPDDGIDGIDDDTQPTIIVQAKRFRSFRSSTQNRKDILSEIDKINRLIAEKNWHHVEYYVVTSGELTPDGSQQIQRAAGSLFRHGSGNLITKTTLKELRNDNRFQDLLKDFHLRPENIVEQLSKAIDNVLDIQTSNFITSVDPRYFVETHIFAEARGVLVDKHVVLIHGLPGVGKTTNSVFLAKMLYASLTQGNQQNDTYILECDVGEAVKVKERYQREYKDSNKRLIVIFDDFLGRSELTTNDTKRRAIVNLFQVALKSSQLYLILNTRTQILNEANVEDFLFGEFTRKLDKKQIQLLVDMSSITPIERARMTRSAFERAYNLSDNDDKKALVEGYETIRNRTDYMQIINHKNFNPRLIELLTNHFGEESEQTSLLEYALKSMDRPKSLYEELFAKLTSDQRRYLFLLISFRLSNVCYSEFETALRQLNFSTDVDFSKIKNQLLGAWIKSVSTDAAHEYLDTINPSVFDYLVEKEAVIPFLRQEILDRSLFLCQLEETQKIKCELQENYGAYHDRNRYADQRLKYLLRDSLTENEKAELTGLISSYGLVDEQMFLHEQRIPSWKTFFDLLDTADLESKQFICKEIFFGLNATSILRRVDKQLKESEIDAVVDDLKSIFIDVFDEEFEQNETVDLIEESTQVNLFTIMTEHKRTQVQDILDGLTGEYFGDISDNIDLNESLDDNKEYIVGMLSSKATEEVQSRIDFSILEGDATPGDFNFSGFVDEVDSEVEAAYYDQQLQEQAESDYDDWEDERVLPSHDDIDDIMDRPLS